MHRTILALLLLLLFSTACAARDSRTLDQIPAYPDAVVLEEAENAMADIMASTLRDFTSEVAESEITLYALPNDATWDAVSAHYDEATAQSDWVPNDALTMSYDDYRARGWRRTGVGDEQLFVISYVNDPVTGQPLLSTAYLK